MVSQPPKGDGAVIAVEEGVVATAIKDEVLRVNGK
jgi:hypothetical protein